jgi:hypothetical protein
MLRRSTTSSVACEQKDRSLVNTRIPRYPPTASPCHGSLAIRPLPRRDMAPSPSAHCLALTWLPRHPLVACGIAVLSLRLLKETPREENSVSRLSFRHWTLAYIALSHFSNDRHSARQRYPSPSNVRELSDSLVQWNVLTLSRTGSFPWLFP